MSKNLLTMVLLSFVFFFWGCGEKKSDSPQNESANKSDLESFADKMKEVSEGFSEGKKVNSSRFP